MPTSRRFRTTPTRHSRAHFSLAESGVDRENLRLQNVVGMETGLALGHDVIADETTLHLVAGLANDRNYQATERAANRGERTGTEVTKKVRQRFGHPAMSSDGTGRTIGTLSNFRVQDSKLLHDTQFYNAARLSPAFSGDVVEYIFTLAEEAPESLNESAVVEASLIWQLESGEEVELTDAEYDQADWGIATPPEGATTEFPILRPFSIGHIDLVSDGALTDSLFTTQSDAERFFSSAFSGHTSIFGAELFELIDRFRDQFGLTLTEIETKGVEIITKYVYVRRNHTTQASEGETIMAKRNINRPNVSQLAFNQSEGAVETVEATSEAAIVFEGETTVSETEPIADEPVIEDSSEPVSATVEDEETAVDDELDEISAIMAETEADETDAEPIETVEALAAVRMRASELSEVVSRQGERIEKITKLMLQQANQFLAISRNLRRLDGERIVTERVPMTNRQSEDGLEQATAPAQDFAPPLHGYVEPHTVGLREFSSVIDGDPPELMLASDTPNAVAEKAAASRVARNQKYRMGTRK